MAETKARVDELVGKLSDLSPEVRLEAIKELGTIDKEHALPALHWAIQNEADESVRNAARDAYQKLSVLARQEQQKAKASTGDKTRNMERPHIQAVTMEEGRPNPLGRYSLYVVATMIVLYLGVMFISSGQDQENLPAIFRYADLGISALSVPGLGLGILGLTRKGRKVIAAYFGTIMNGIAFLLFFLNVIRRVS
jgi:hypothetical protein